MMEEMKVAMSAATRELKKVFLLARLTVSKMASTMASRTETSRALWSETTNVAIKVAWMEEKLDKQRVETTERL